MNELIGQSLARVLGSACGWGLGFVLVLVLTRIF
jgi:hypothetical protein